MRKYVSTSINANYFRECVASYLSEVHHSPQSELSFWQFVNTIAFKDGMISRDCKIYKEMEAYANKHPITKIAVVWQLYFENAEADLIREVLLYLMEEKEKRQDDRKKRKNDTYATTLDGFNSFVRQYKFKLKQSGVPDDLLEEFDDMQDEWQEEVKTRMSEYKDNDIPLDEGFYFFLFNLKIEVKQQAAKLIGNMDCVEVAV